MLTWYAGYPQAQNKSHQHKPSSHSKRLPCDKFQQKGKPNANLEVTKKIENIK